jgi:hypothetical protein
MTGFNIYLKIGGRKVCVEVDSETPEEAIEIVKDLFKEIESKVEELRVADRASGFFLRGYS